MKVARGLAPDDDPAPWADELPHHAETVLIVSHMPFVAELAALLEARGASRSFATAEIACFERQGDAYRLASSWRPGD